MYERIDAGIIDRSLHRKIEFDLLENFNERWAALIQAEEIQLIEDGNFHSPTPSFEMAFWESVTTVCREEMSASSGDEMDDMIASLIENNIDQWNAAKQKPKLANWFVGQVMKESQGKADAATVREKISTLLNQDG